MQQPPQPTLPLRLLITLCTKRPGGQFEAAPVDFFEGLYFLIRKSGSLGFSAGILQESRAKIGIHIDARQECLEVP